MWTVWLLRSVDGSEEKPVVHPAFPDDYRYTHAYQQILWRGEAPSRAEALNRAASSAGGHRP